MERFIEVMPSNMEISLMLRGMSWACLPYYCGICGKAIFYRGYTRHPHNTHSAVVSSFTGTGVWADTTKRAFHAKSYLCLECKEKEEAR